MGTAVTLNRTLLDADFVVRQVDRLDIGGVAMDLIGDDLLASVLGGAVPQEFDFLQEAIAKTVADVEPWISEQVAVAIYTLYDYVNGDSDSLVIDLTLEHVRTTIEANLTEAMRRELGPENEFLLAAIIPTIMTQVPATMSLDLAEYEPAVADGLTLARSYFGYCRIVFWGGIAFSVLLALLIVLIFRRVRGAAITLGVVSLLFGAGMLAARFASDYTVISFLPFYLVPAGLEVWLREVIYEVLAPVLWMCIIFGLAGLALITLGALYPKREAH